MLKYQRTDSDELIVDVFSDSDWADELHRRSRGGYLIFVNKQLIDWRAWIHSTISLSSTEAELVSATEAMTQLRYLLFILQDFGQTPTAITLHLDNKAAIQSITNPVVTNRTKHLDVKVKYLRLLHDANVFRVEWVSSMNNPADALTKMSTREQFERHCFFMFNGSFPTS